MIVLIDNYDSFSYNLYQMVGAIAPDIRVIRNDEMTVEEIKKMNPDKIIISPGPGRPKDAGICIQVIQELAGQVPILGVCLGHQAIFEAFGGNVTYAKHLMHGKQSIVKQQEDSKLFQNLPEEFPVARYHSLIGEKESLPEKLVVTAFSEDGEIMAVQHREYPVFGVQFHPESIMTPDGIVILQNFINI